MVSLIIIFYRRFCYGAATAIGSLNGPCIYQPKVNATLQGDITKILEGKIVNHQRYEVTFKRDGHNGRTFCDLKKGNELRSNVPLFVDPHFSFSQVKNPFSLTYFSKEHCVYLGRYGLQGGGEDFSKNDKLQELMTMTDSKLELTVAQRLPKNVYTCITARTVDYSFGGLVPNCSTRLISLSLNKKDVACSVFMAIVGGLGLACTERFKDIDQSQLQEELLQSICGKNTTKEEIEKAYAQSTHIDLYIAQDLSKIEMTLRKSNAIVVVYQVAQITKIVAPIIFSIAVGPFAT